MALLKPGFSHCLLLHRVPGGWVLLDPSFGGLEISVFGEDVDVPGKLRGAGCAVVAARKEEYRQGILRPPTYCVSFVRYALGIKNLTLTPYRLYLDLVDKSHGLRL